LYTGTSTSALPSPIALDDLHLDVAAHAHQEVTADSETAIQQQRDKGRATIQSVGQQ
jgi:hypothetical protein